MSWAISCARQHAKVVMKKQIVLLIMIVLRPKMSAKRPQKGYQLA